MNTISELRKKAIDRMAERKHTIGWATHCCTICGYRTRVQSAITNPRCQVCGQYGTLVKTNGDKIADRKTFLLRILEGGNVCEQEGEDKRILQKPREL